MVSVRTNVPSAPCSLQQRVGLGDRPVVQRDGVTVVGEVARDVRTHHRQAGDADLSGAVGGFRFELIRQPFVVVLSAKTSADCRLRDKSRWSSVSQGTASAPPSGPRAPRAAAAYAASDSTDCCRRPPKPAHPDTVVGPPAASAPAGAGPAAQATSARASGRGPAARTAASSASNSTSSRTASSACPLRTQRGNAACIAVNISSTRSCRARRWARSWRRIAVDLVVRQRGQRALAEHDPAAYAGQAVGQRLVDVEHPQHVAGRAAGAPSDCPDQVDDHPVMCPAAPGRDGHPHDGEAPASHRSAG